MPGDFVANKEVAEGVILDMGEGDVVLGIEILEASTRLSLGDLARVEVLMPLERTTVQAWETYFRSSVQSRVTLQSWEQLQTRYFVA